jgi:LysR family transcriptional regulator, cyn operon transcriptional activator
MRRDVMSPTSLRYLLAIAEHHSFTRAAESLYVSQPTLSQQIKQLEESLDVQLLDRSGRNVHLTDAGEVYLSYARRALGELEAGKRAINEVQDLSRGSLRIGMTPITDYLAAPLLDAFNARYPGISLSTVEMPQDDIETGIIEDRIDVGIAFTNILSSEARSNEIDTQLLFIESLNLAVGSDHPSADKQALQSEQVLEEQPLVMLKSNFALRRHIDLYCLEHSITPHIVMETNSLSVIVEILRLGRLASILPNTIACAQHGIRSVLLVPQLPHHTITLICHKGTYKSPACRAFSELAAEWGIAGCQAIPKRRADACPMSNVCDPGECS